MSEPAVQYAFVLSPVAVAVNAWRSVADSFVRMPALLVLLIAAESAVTYGVFRLLAEFRFAVLLVPRVVPWGLMLALSGLMLANTIPYAVAGVTMSRLVVLGEVDWARSALLPTAARYLLWLAGLFAAAVAIELMTLLFAFVSMALAVISAVGVMIFLFVASVRLSLLFPALATDERSASLDSSWRQSRGSFWRIFWSGVLAELALQLSALIAEVLILGFLKDFGSDEILFWTKVILGGASLATGSLLTAAVTAWIYKSLPAEGVRDYRPAPA